MSSIRSTPKKSFMTNVLSFKQTLFSPAPCMHDKTLSVNSKILKQEKNFGYVEVRKAQADIQKQNCNIDFKDQKTLDNVSMAEKMIAQTPSPSISQPEMQHKILKKNNQWSLRAPFDTNIVDPKQIRQQFKDYLPPIFYRWMKNMTQEQVMTIYQQLSKTQKFINSRQLKYDQLSKLRQNQMEEQK